MDRYVKTQLSIVTVTFKDDEGLARTLSSIRGILEDGRQAVELIVVDGGVSESARALIDAEAPGARLISEPDEGIYDAMNKGLENARGGHVWFLNGGDEAIISWSDLQGLLREGDGSVLLNGYELRGRENIVSRRSRRARSIWHALPTSHQAILYPRVAIGSLRYDSRFGIVGDYAFTAYLFAQGVPFRRSSTRLARFYLDGTSTQNAELIGRQAGVVQAEVLRRGVLIRSVSRVRHRASKLYRELLSRR